MSVQVGATHIRLVDCDCGAKNDKAAVTREFVVRANRSSRVSPSSPSSFFPLLLLFVLCPHILFLVTFISPLSQVPLLFAFLTSTSSSHLFHPPRLSHLTNMIFFSSRHSPPSLLPYPPQYERAGELFLAVATAAANDNSNVSSYVSSNSITCIYDGASSSGAGSRFAHLASAVRQALSSSEDCLGVSSVNNFAICAVYTKQISKAIAALEELVVRNPAANMSDPGIGSCWSCVCVVHSFAVVLVSSVTVQIICSIADNRHQSLTTANSHNTTTH
jgi:hypothetical protein